MSCTTIVIFIESHEIHCSGNPRFGFADAILNYYIFATKSPPKPTIVSMKEWEPLCRTKLKPTEIFEN